jgi:hypothetical protein
MICPLSSSATGTSVKDLRSVQLPRPLSRSRGGCRESIALKQCIHGASGLRSRCARFRFRQSIRNGAASEITASSQIDGGQCGLLSKVVLCTRGWRTLPVWLDIASGRARAGGIHRPSFLAPFVLPVFSMPDCGAGPSFCAKVKLLIKQKQRPRRTFSLALL